MATKSGFAGIYPMVYALFGADGRLSRDGTRRQVEAMLRHGVHGVGVLGLASEVNKLSLAERHQLMEWVAEDVGGAVPVAVTIAEPNVAAQIEFARAAAATGAQWVILQPPPVRGVPETELIRFFGAVAEASPLPVAIQNAPEYLGVGLSPEGLLALFRTHPNVAIVKVEASALAISRLHAALEGSVDIFNGRGGIDIVDAVRAGAVGVIPGGECFDALKSIFEDLTIPGGDTRRAARRYAALLPMLVFLMESMDTFIVYGKQVLRERLGLLEIHQRLPVSPATGFGLQAAHRYAASLGAL
jgi:dihydrodipicolinate synthase/N-acetylneuraminate lyase